ncbi:MAG: hypothetical protein PVJ30_03510 [Thiohalocapsa sp.]|jgi:hypothetical protein
MRSTSLYSTLPIIALLAVLNPFLAGCAGGRMGPVPPLTASEPAASVTVQRSRSVLGAPASMLFSIDDRRVYALRLGQQFSFNIDPGVYTFGYSLGFNDCKQLVTLEPGESYVVRLTPVCRIEIFRYGEVR